VLAFPLDTATELTLRHDNFVNCLLWGDISANSTTECQVAESLGFWLAVLLGALGCHDPIYFP
jgi:hypothetical protein